MADSGVGGGRLVVGMDTCGGAGGGEAICGFVWWLERRRERGRETAETGQWGAGILSTLDPIFSFLRQSTPHLFIGGGRG